ncbi:ABC transporter permease [Streptomyces odontomachi]|uniref:ABC transporter permease n=1 Tax=Streptomyces odontomachi TaxID=2944940 RepID=UPI00210CE26E|nr:FtsX-like permease family protein [Streptomyces sp. ODS25]
MTAPDGTPPTAHRRAAAHTWVRDLAMGARFAAEGGRESWVRTLLTAVGVGLGVAVLLVAAAVPGALGRQDARKEARENAWTSDTLLKKADDTLLFAANDTTYRDQDIRGRLVRPEGPEAPLPPGVAAYPEPGEMLVSPALRKLLASDESALLRERLPFRIVGTIGDEGLAGPGELTYLAGAHLSIGDASSGVQRINAYSTPAPSRDLDPVLLLLVLIVIVVLLMPVGVFIAAAVRFGGERRDRRLAALRLIGADGPMARRIAAGEAMAGAALGLLFGAGLFVIARQLASHVTLFGNSFFPSDLTPSPGLSAMIACAVPAAAVGVTMVALRGVVIEPLGVVRATRPTRRRLWWRLLLPLGGVAMLYATIGRVDSTDPLYQWLVIGGTVLLLAGVTVLLPWAVETVVARLGGGPVSWQLAVRRLQLSSGTAARMVNGIAVAVAGAIALQMLFTGVAGSYTTATDNDLSRARLAVSLPVGAPSAPIERALRKTDGVRHTIALGEVSLGERAENPDAYTSLTVGSCAALRETAQLPECHEGDGFVIAGTPSDGATGRVARPGRTMYADPTADGIPGREIPWRLPRVLRKAESRTDPMGAVRDGVLVTPSALPAQLLDAVTSHVYVRVDPSAPDVDDRVRTVAAQAGPLAQVDTLEAHHQSGQFASIRTGLLAGATCVLALIGASMLVTQLEQLRERRKLLSALVAFGTRRRTLSLSVLWQTAIPVALGLLLASVVGLTLGGILLKTAEEPISPDWSGLATMTAAGAALVLAVTALAMPLLVRLMRPDGLRAE